jgi:hypothetical protein
LPLCYDGITIKSREICAQRGRRKNFMYGCQSILDYAVRKIPTRLTISFPFPPRKVPLFKDYRQFKWWRHKKRHRQTKESRQTDVQTEKGRRRGYCKICILKDVSNKIIFYYVHLVALKRHRKVCNENYRNKSLFQMKTNRMCQKDTPTKLWHLLLQALLKKLDYIIVNKSLTTII